MFAAARTHLLSTGLPDSYFSLALDYAMYVDLRMATTASRDWKTPYEMIKGTPPDSKSIKLEEAIENILNVRSSTLAYSRR